MTDDIEGPPRLDWRDPATYSYTRDLPPEGWAWEFLRRNPKYRSSWSEGRHRARAA